MKNISYDASGNILGFTRNDINGTLIDNLTYQYKSDQNSNQLDCISDFGTDAGYARNTSEVPNYSYDANGNMTKHILKGITNITYNYLNLPAQINFGNDRKISYLYSAATGKTSE